MKSKNIEIKIYCDGKVVSHRKMTRKTFPDVIEIDFDNKSFTMSHGQAGKYMLERILGVKEVTNDTEDKRRS